MAGGGIIKDVREVYSSTFDHTPIIRKEVDFFVKEFEQSRNDREVDRLFRILERVTELKETGIPKSQALGDIHLPKLVGELQVAESISSKLIEKRLKAEGDFVSKLATRRQERVKEWDTFVHDMTSKCIKIDSSFKEKEEEIRDLYKKAEDRLLKEQLKTSNPAS